MRTPEAKILSSSSGQGIIRRLIEYLLDQGGYVVARGERCTSDMQARWTLVFCGRLIRWTGIQERCGERRDYGRCPRGRRSTPRFSRRRRCRHCGDSRGCARPTARRGRGTIRPASLPSLAAGRARIAILANGVGVEILDDGFEAGTELPSVQRLVRADRSSEF